MARMVRTLITSSILLGLNLGFICLGGFIMSILERNGGNDKMEKLLKLKVEVIGATNATVEFSDVDLAGNATLACVTGKSIPWTYGQSFNFALSIITTVGWGVMSPSSYTCKAVVCLYALFGIPIYLMFIALIKDKCGKAFRKTVRVSREVSWYWMILSFVVMVTIFVNIAINMGIETGKEKLRELANIKCSTITPYTHWQENSTIWDGIYFGFITVSTIGFGDKYLRLFECEGQSMDSVVSAVAGFFLFSVLLGMTAHLFDVLSENGENSLRRFSEGVSKKMSNDGGAPISHQAQRIYGR